MFRAHSGPVPSDFVSTADAEQYARLALGAIRAKDIKHFGIRVGCEFLKLRDSSAFRRRCVANCRIK